MDTNTARDYTSRIAITQTGVLSHVASNGGRSSSSGLTSSQAGDHLTPTSYPHCRLQTLQYQKLFLYKASARTAYKTTFSPFLYYWDHVIGVGHCLAIGVFAELFPSNGRLSGSLILAVRLHVTIITNIVPILLHRKVYF
jgi:hypothetical protein